MAVGERVSSLLVVVNMVVMVVVRIRGKKTGGESVSVGVVLSVGMSVRVWG